MTDTLTPCIKICQLNESQTICVGCGRTIEQITNWRQMSAKERRQIMDKLATTNTQEPMPPPRSTPVF